ncbi:MAG: permease [Alphaproteobacteria bacterium]|nr:permease [Alphaproteobacteria bacterium]|tara:strand:- start:359 stop:1276 length:918 start_codon:yes stop_codon:yes gene_type:complete
MDIYLPIAELSTNLFVLLGLGLAVGFLSGLFGVGGGFLMTPLLIFIGIPAVVAVGTGTNLIVASSISGMIAHWRRGNVDFRMGSLLFCGGIVGSWLGVELFKELREAGQIELVISLFYVIFLLVVGILMGLESTRALFYQSRQIQRKANYHTWIHGLPIKLRFRQSKLYVSAIPPVVIGFTMGLLASFMGVGGGFIMVPVLIYLIGMPTAVVIGTSLLSILVISAMSSVAHAISNQNVDIILTLILAVGAVIGAQYGTRFGLRLKAVQLRGLLALMVLTVAGRLIFGLLNRPSELFSITVLESSI